MGAEKFIEIVRIIKKYAEVTSQKRIYDPDKIPLNSYAINDEDYEYVIDNTRRLSYLQYLLHGAIGKIDDVGFEESIKNYIIHELKLFLGMYFFIDPSEVKHGEAKSHYVFGAVKKDDLLKPSFTFPHFFNIKNNDGNEEFHQLSDEWQEFYSRVLTLTRGSVKFKDDFVKYFSEKDGFEWRRCENERKNNFLYVSSGEIDHTILQWLFCLLSSLKNYTVNDWDKKKFKINLKELDHAEVLKPIFDDNSNIVVRKIFVTKSGKIYLSKDGVEALNLTLKEWIEHFGLHDNNFPTERLIAAIGFFYIHLKNSESKAKDYFSIDKEKRYYTDNVISEKFIKTFEEFLPLINNSTDLTKNLNSKVEIDILIQLYFNLLSLFAKKNRNLEFSNYARVQSMSPFFQRNIPFFYDSKYKEYSCRGFVVFPIFSNPNQNEAEVYNYLKNLGYFLGVIKDSDPKGRCYFNWDTHSENTANCNSESYFYTHFIFYLQNFVYTLGQNEVQQIYYKGIASRNNREIQNQATRAAISQVMARNGSHNIGSHVLNKLINGLSKKDFNNRNYQESLFFLVEHHTSLSDCFTKEGHPFEYCTDLTFAQIEYFNSYIKNRMEYLGDMAMNTPLMSSSKDLINDIFRDFDKLRLLLDNISGLDEKFKYSFKFISINGIEVTKEDYSENDIKLAIANDITGCQAFYNILENIIRNTAKHSSSSEDVVFTIKVQNTIEENGTDASEYYQINVYDNIEKEGIDEKVKSQNEILNKNIIDESTNNLRQGSLGMIEMDASAAYLRMLDIAEINNDEYEIIYDETSKIYKTKSGKLPLLNAYSFKKESSSKTPKCLGYQFYIAKPKEVLFVLENTTEINENKAEGIYVLNKEDFIKKIIDKRTFTHQFVITDFEFGDEIKKHKAQYSPRVINLGTNNPADFIKDIDKVWQKWVCDYLLQNSEKKIYKVRLDDFDKSKNCSQLVFNDHELDISKLKTKLTESNPQYLSFEILSSLAQSKLPKFNQINANNTIFETKLQVYESNLSNGEPTVRSLLGEAAQNKIVVIDERVQQFSKENYHYKETSILHYVLYQAMNIFIPLPGDINLGEFQENVYPTFEYDLNNKELNESLIEEITSLIGRTNPKFLVIHYGILERVFGNEKESKIPDLLNDWASKYCEMEIVITSGRTRLDGLPTNIRFLNLAPLSSAFTDIRCKYVINKILNDSRI